MAKNESWHSSCVGTCFTDHVGVIFIWFNLFCILLITMILNIPWKVTVWPVMFKFAILLSMAPCSICSTTRSEGRLALKVTLMVIWTKVPPTQVAETYNTFITYLIESLVNKSLSCQKRNKFYYSRNSTDGHLSTTATFFCPRGGRLGMVHLCNIRILKNVFFSLSVLSLMMASMANMVYVTILRLSASI